MYSLTIEWRADVARGASRRCHATGQTRGKHVTIDSLEQGPRDSSAASRA
jgi:hypothetical protein